MKKILLPILLFSFVATQIQAAKSTCADSCHEEATSKTYLAIHPMFQSASPELVSAFRDERVHILGEEGHYGAIQFALFGGKTTDEEDLARYFFPDSKTSLLVAEGSSTVENLIERDLNPDQFNVSTVNGDFRSQISIEPEHSTIGFGAHFRKSFWRNEEKERGFWFSASTAITRVKTNMNFKEKVLSDGGGAAEGFLGSMKEAFVQSDWNYGKIAGITKTGNKCSKNNCDSMTKTTLADIELKLGYEWLEREPCHLESYVALIIPTGNRPEGVYVFEPIVGRGKHFGVGFGSSFGMEIWKNEEEERYIRVEHALHSEYLFEKEHIRSFDLKNMPWSRYMQVYANEAQAQQAADNDDVDLATPGINVFTQKVKVRPRFQANHNVAFVYTSKGFQGEAGYNFFAKQAECVKLACPWQEGPALKDSQGEGITNPIREISGNPLREVINVRNMGADNGIPVEDYEKSIIKESDLDLQSAATPCILAHTFYGALGYRWDDREYPTFINFGASYTFSRSNNAAAQRYGIWGKVGFSY